MNIHGVESLVTISPDALTAGKDETVSMYYIPLSGTDEGKFFRLDREFPLSPMSDNGQLPQLMRVHHGSVDKAVFVMSDAIGDGNVAAHRGAVVWLSDGTAGSIRLGLMSGGRKPRTFF